MQEHPVIGSEGVDMRGLVRRLVDRFTLTEERIERVRQTVESEVVGRIAEQVEECRALSEEARKAG